MASSPETPGWTRGLRAAALGLALACVVMPGCSIGAGEGLFEGWVSVEDCKDIPAYTLKPSFFGAEAITGEEPLEIRIQRGSGLASVSDGLYILVRDAADVQDNRLGQEMTVNNDEGPVGITFYLNRTCPLSNDRSPVTLPATGGTVRFDAIYSPEGDEADAEIAGELTAVTFADPRNPARSAELSGFFRFFYTRGRPAQLFP